MNRAYAGAGALMSGSPAIAPTAEDRWLPSPGRRASFAMTGVALASLAIHALLLALTALDKHAEVARPEITVELVQEPKPEESKPKPEPPKAEAPKGETPKPETPKAEEPKPAPPPAAKPEPPKAETPKPVPEPAKSEPAKPEPAKPEAAKTEPKPEPPKAPPPDPQAKNATEAAADAKLAASEKALQDLQREYESLKAEQEALKAEAAAQPPEPPADVMGGATVNGMPTSFAAVALPGLSEIDGLATSYQQLVFSQLAKAKGIRQHMGLPGTTRVAFSVDQSGKLVAATIAVPSGIAALDAEALEIVRAAGPFPKPPAGAERTFTANFTFVPQATP